MEANEEQKLLPQPSHRSTYVHRLESFTEGASAVEQLAAKIEQRRKHRICVTLPVRINLLIQCQEIAEEKGYDSKKKIRREDLVSLRDQYWEEVNTQRKSWLPCIPIFFGIKTFDLYMLEALDRAILHFDTISDDWFHHVEWTFYHTKVVSKWPWMRNKTANALLVVLVFYFSTPFLFCYILADGNICNKSEGFDWLQGLYFASVTLSTVGYGDMVVDETNITVGTLYMIVSICVSILAFSAAAGQTFLTFERFFRFETKDVAKDQVLSIRLIIIALWKIGEVVAQFVILNLFGVIVSRFFQGNISRIDEGSTWTWSESIYWSVQSTTTIGYGDMTMSDEMRLFQVFYLCLGTFLVGNTLGKLASLKTDMGNMRRQYAWQQREVSKEMIRTDQADTDDPKVDQYEFVVASLLNLGKVDSSDLKPIMDKFRTLATASGDKGYIDLGAIEC